MPIVNPSETKAILHKHGIRLTKRLGQHFLVDGNVLENELTAAALTKNDTVIEIGPGIGTLTQALAALAGQVVTIEFDPRFPPILNETLALARNVEIIETDAMTVDYASLPANCLVANLPYNIGTALIVKVLIEAPAIERLTVMVQKEVAARLVAVPGTKDYGVLAVTVACYATAVTAGFVKRTSFLPPPEVDSAVVVMNRLPAPLFGPQTPAFLQFVKTVFSLRRKTLVSVLGHAGYGSALIRSALAAAGVEERIRAETLAPAEIYRVYAGLLSPKS